MKDLKKELVELLSNRINNSNYVDVCDVVDILLSEYQIKVENDFESTIIEKGYYYLVKFKSGNYGEVFYNSHGQFMFNHKNVEESIDKVFTPKTK